jgi:serralysin
MAIITGTNSGETLVGTNDSDTIDALGGNDTVFGLDGDDTINGGEGNDTLNGNNHNDTLNGNDGDDILNGDNGNDALNGQDGNDTLNGGAGDDTMAGGVGNDIYIVDTVGDVVIENAGEGTDEIRTNRAVYSLAALPNVENLTGTSAFHTLTGNALNNVITGGVAADVIDGGAGADTMIGGFGNDEYTVDDVGDLVVEAASQGEDTIRTNLAAFSLTALPNVERLTGTSNAGQSLTGNDAANIINAGDGNDTLDGGDGNDQLNGGLGADSMIGGLGDDVFTVDDAGDNAVENVGSGDDQVLTSLASYALAANIERLRGTSNAGQTLSGNDLDNEISGGSGADVMNGLGGNDTFNGGAGDTMAGGTGDDVYNVPRFAIVTINENADEGIDTVISRTPVFSLASMPNVENLTFLANDQFDGAFLTGNDLNNVIRGGIAGDQINGGLGADIMIGGRGNDEYSVDNAGDLVVELANEGIDRVHASVSFSIAAMSNVENLTATSNGGLSLTGNAENNIITGGAGNDTLDGGAGNDQLLGGAGVDTMIGGLGDDLFVVDNEDDVATENSGEGYDRVEASASRYTLAAHIEELTGTGSSQALTGNAQDNTIRGSGGADVLDGGDGNDTLEGRGGNDVLIGGAGDDLYLAVDSDDTVIELENGGIDTVSTALASYTLGDNVENLHGGSAQPSTLTGNNLDNMILRTATGSGDDYLYGLGGNDFLNGGSGRDFLAGGTGNDTYVVQESSDVVIEAPNEGDDTVRTSLAQYSLESLVNVENLTGFSSGTQTLTGNAGANVITGGAGATTLDGGLGADTLIGGAGNDIYFVDGGDLVVENPHEGYDIVYARGDHALAAGSHVEVLATISNLATDAIDLYGNDYANYLVGNAGSNTLDGGVGLADQLWGREGDDSYIVSTLDTVVEYVGQGYDIVYARSSFILATGVSIEVLATFDNLAATAINLTGNELDNYVTGNAGSNTLDGGAGGADTLWGREGDDSYFADGNDTVIEYAGHGHDIVYARTSYALGAGVSVEVLATINNLATDAINLTGNELANYVTGNAGNNTLDGGAGSDTLWGREGDDSYFADGNDAVIEYAGQGYDIVYARSNFVLGAQAHVEVLGTINNLATDAISLTGNELANYVTGNAGANTIDGGAGADNLQGRGGADTFAFSTALGGGNIDAILDFASGTDRIALDDAVFAALAPGALAAGAFRIGTTAQDADDRILYDSATGALYYDDDGNGAHAAVQFALLTGAPPLAAADFIIV